MTQDYWENLYQIVSLNTQSMFLFLIFLSIMVIPARFSLLNF